MTDSAFAALADAYLLLGLRFDKHQPGVLDAHYGRASALKITVDAEPVVPLDTLQRDAERILSALADNASARAAYIHKQTLALKTMIEKKLGTSFSFRDEARLCLGIDHIERQDDAELLDAIAQLDAALPGSGNLSERFVQWRKKFELHGDDLTRFINAAMLDAKRKTESLFRLPDNDVEVSLVRDKPWAGYHWYRGGFKSLYELNIDVPTTIWNVLHTTTHEAYCGHHTEAVVKESELVNHLGYDEFTMNLLGTPCSLISEGVAEAAEHLIIGNVDATIEWLRQHQSLHGRDFTEHDAKIFRAMERLGRRAVVNAALLMHEEHASDEEVFAYLRRVSPSESELIRRTIERLRDEAYRTYMLTYPIGKELVLRDLNTAKDKSAKFYEILKSIDYRFN
ncbi:MAG: hypothetical protein HY22_03520 [[Candidatus Thermochlorobacteriaceae] bacterium GBChlB]|nr:MAG: hypothetical protein HY22_03520 [[Candidatus Thermochlorobacteriaceae] bacterium GBChlB]